MWHARHSGVIATPKRWPGVAMCPGARAAWRPSGVETISSGANHSKDPRTATKARSSCPAPMA